MPGEPTMTSPRLLGRIESALHAFSPNDRRIADYLLLAYPQTTWGTVEEVAQAAGVSKSAVVRFAARLGYEGFQDLQRELQTDFAELLASPSRLVKQRTESSGPQTVNAALERALDNLQRTHARLVSSNHFDDVARHLAACRGKILIVGLRKSFGLAAYLHYLLSSVRPNVVLARPDTSTFPEGLIDLGRDDVLLALSVRRYTRMTLQAMEYARAAGSFVVAITDTVAGPATPRADVVLAGLSESVLLFDSALSVIFIAETLANSMVALRYDDALSRLELTESVGRKFALFQDATAVPGPGSLQSRRLRARGADVVS
ncbi:MAG TPA: MurR/RpiR family transcriptional regulator [Gaiellaceae bacterium]|nr:MurR/RpiR family transcriptional regulator [Gaiellaceae bacterium]